MVMWQINYTAHMNLVLLLITFLLLFGGLGLYLGGPAFGGITLGLVLIIAWVLYSMGTFRSRARDSSSG
jgi:hypothetical protein